MLQTETIIGLIASSATAASLIPQLIKIVREKKAEDVSLLMLAILLVGLSCWVWYGILKNDWIIIISNSFSVLFNVCVVIMTVRYQSK
ncbi:MAG: SemiSWEET transporter [Bacteroidota bacterium]|nr:SemiSWEET transporter [Bacteroidota bacterium]